MFKKLSLLILLLFILVACDPTATPTITVEPTDTVVPPTETVVSPTETLEPTEEPTDIPTEEPTDEPTDEPTVEPTEEPTEEPTVEPTATPRPPQEFMWLSPEEIENNPLSQRIIEYANAQSQPDLSNQDNNADAMVYAAALVCVGQENEFYCEKARQYIMAAIGTEDGGRTLALGRNLTAYIIAADLVGLSPEQDNEFKAWLDEVRFKNLDGRSLVETHEERANNWGTNAGAARIAAALYLDDAEELQAAADVFYGWLGNRSAYTGFNFGSLSWQANPNEPVGINPKGATIEGHNVDGVLPDDQRRAGDFTWPPPCENYAWGALQGVAVQALLLDRAGYSAFSWEDNAIERAVTWLYNVADCPANGDDTGTPYLVDAIYGTNFASGSVDHPGKNGLGFYDWQFGN